MLVLLQFKIQILEGNPVPQDPDQPIRPRRPEDYGLFRPRPRHSDVAADEDEDKVPITRDSVKHPVRPRPKKADPPEDADDDDEDEDEDEDDENDQLAPPKPKINPYAVAADVKKALEQVERIRELIEQVSPEKRSVAPQFFTNVYTSAASLGETVQKMGRVSERQQQALNNWEAAVKKWHPKYRSK